MIRRHVLLVLGLLCIGTDRPKAGREQPLSGDQKKRHRQTQMLDTALEKGGAVSVLVANRLHWHLLEYGESHGVSVRYSGMLGWKEVGRAPLGAASAVTWILEEAHADASRSDNWLSIMVSPCRGYADDVEVCVLGTTLYIQLFDYSGNEQVGTKMVGMSSDAFLCELGKFIREGAEN